MDASKRHQTIWLVIIFSLLVNAAAWLAPVLGGSPESPGPGFVLWGTAPLVVSLLLRAITRDWSDLGIRPAIRKNLLWYAVSFLALPVVMVLALLIGVSFSLATFTGFSMAKFLQTTLPPCRSS